MISETIRALLALLGPVADTIVSQIVDHELAARDKSGSYLDKDRELAITITPRRSNELHLAVELLWAISDGDQELTQRLIEESQHVIKTEPELSRVMPAVGRDGYFTRELPSEYPPQEQS